MDLPWTSRAEMQPGPEYLVMASHLPLKRITGTMRFIRAVSAIRKQPTRADGLVGYTLRPLMGPTRFITWNIRGADGRPDLTGALQRLASR
jgi:hypothetical protein